MMDKESPSPLAERERALNRRCLSGNYHKTLNTKTRGPQLTTLIAVETFIGRTHIVLRTTRSIYDPNVLNIEFWPFKNRPRKGQLRRVRVRGARIDRRVTIRRFNEPTSAAKVYHATRRALGIGLLPWGTNGEGSLTEMWAAQLTDSGARSVAGRQLAAQMRSLGVSVSGEPALARYPAEFWWADC
jgi:hypothetical protein